MEVSFFLGFALMWMAIFLAKSVSAKEIRKLEDKKKAELVDMAAARRGTQFAVLIAGIGAFYLISYFIEDHREVWFGLYALFILIWMVYQMFAVLKSYRSKAFPDDFIKAQLNAGMIRLIGIAAFFTCVGLNFVFY